MVLNVFRVKKAEALSKNYIDAIMKNFKGCFIEMVDFGHQSNDAYSMMLIQ